MPVVSIDLHEGATTPAQRQAISDAIHAAMVEVLGIPDDDRFHFFHELPVGSIFHEDTAFGVARTQRLLFITLSFNERTAEIKNALFEALVRHLGTIAGWQKDEVMFRVIETARENWWAYGRVVNPDTGYDERMAGQASTLAAAGGE